MARNYTLLTIKTLFGAASNCAHPTCHESLIFAERGAETVVAEIAHIRSEVEKGPRYDPDFTGDINGPENLLLLCGKHHRAVDRHASTYTTSELLIWKIAQLDSGGSLPLDANDIRHYRRLTEQESSVLLQVARLAQRVVNVSASAQQAVDEVRDAKKQATDQANVSFGAIYELDEDGQRHRVKFELPYGELVQWHERAQAALAAQRPFLQAAQDQLAEEVAVLQMSAGASASAGRQVRQAAALVLAAVGDAAALTAAQINLDTEVSTLWQTANGEGLESAPDARSS